MGSAGGDVMVGRGHGGVGGMGRPVSAVAFGLRLPRTVTGCGRRSLAFFVLLAVFLQPRPLPRPLPLARCLQEAACYITGAGGAWGFHLGLGGGGGVRVGNVPPAAVHRGSGVAHRPHPARPSCETCASMARGMGMPPRSVPPPSSLRMHTPDHSRHTRPIPTPAPLLSAGPSSLIPTCVPRANRPFCPHASSSRAGRSRPLSSHPPSRHNLHHLHRLLQLLVR